VKNFLKKMAKGKSNGSSTDATTVGATGKFSVIVHPDDKEFAKAAAAGASNGAGSSAAKNDAGLQGRRATAASGPKIEATAKGDDTGVKIGGDSFVKRTKDPAWLKDRDAVYETIKARRTEELSTKKPVDITVTMPDGNVLSTNKSGENFQAWKTSPFDVAATISQGLADSSTVARVTYASFVDDYDLSKDGMDGVDTLGEAMADGGVEADEGKGGTGQEMVFLWDLMRPLVGNVAKLELLKFADDRDAKTVFWHSSAHMMGEALEHLMGSKLTIGPPLAGGFYYDSYMGSDVLREEDCKYCIVFLFRNSQHLMLEGWAARNPHNCLTYFFCV